MAALRKKTAWSDKKKNTEEDASLPEMTADDLLWGINTVLEALRRNARCLGELLVQKGKAGPKVQEIIDLARQHKVRVRFVEAEHLPVPRNCRHQGVVARQTEAELLSLEELLEQVDFDRILILDSIQDPRNLGSILRSALAAGFRSIILTRERSAPLSGTVARTSAGAISHLRIAQVVNLVTTLELLKERGFWIYGSVAEPTAPSIYSTDFSGQLGLVIGSEGKGIRPLVRKHCDQLVTIPMSTDFDSLNASVAAALIMFEVVRKENTVEEQQA
ncbi:MAG: 23S rRNA (guanosine(2251)-2'-O)-methyltransferase RlmB [Candidatus Electrothrix sp. Rat3]|nr:23S rRNA (guanosine(2251)-2'-O)-methyltransferase RlmB [Candidatus Electrothrix rattekaaiensis]